MTDNKNTGNKGKPKLTVVGDTGKKRTGTRKKSATNTKGLTDKQEAFAQAIFEGSNFSDAYRQAYDASNMSAASIHNEACLLVQNPKVSMRLEQLNANREAEQRMQRLSRSERVISKLEEIALRQGDADGTQVRALELLGKSMGMWIDKVETEDKTQRTADEIERDLMERLKSLGVG